MKTLAKLFMLALIAVIIGGGYIWWRTSISFTVMATDDPGPSYTLQADDFLIEIPDSYQLTFLNGLLQWPDGFRLDFQEYIDSEAQQLEARYNRPFTPDDLERGAEKYDLSRELGRPSIMAYYPPDKRRAEAELSLMVKFHNGLTIFRLPAYRLSGSGEPDAQLAENKRLFLLSVKEFMESYYWTGSHIGRPEPGVFRTRLGLISKKKTDGFRYWPMKAVFWSNDLAQSFELTAVRGESTGDLCSLGRLDRFSRQWSGQAAYRSNCLGLTVGGRRGAELLSLRESGLEKSPYQLAWIPDQAGQEGGKPCFSFHMNSPLRSADKDQTPEGPESVIGRWRAMLATVRFF